MWSVLDSNTSSLFIFLYPNLWVAKGMRFVLSVSSKMNGAALFWLQKCIVLDIEGTTTPISFVTDVLFPYARDSVGKHLSLTYGTTETIDDINLLRAQVRMFVCTYLISLLEIFFPAYILLCGCPIVFEWSLKAFCLEYVGFSTLSLKTNSLLILWQLLDSVQSFWIV